MHYLDCKMSFYKHFIKLFIYGHQCELEYCRNINFQGDKISLFCYPNWLCGDSLYEIMHKSFVEDFNKIWSPAKFSAFTVLFLKLIIEYVMLHSCFNIFLTGFLMLDGRVLMPWKCYRFINVCHRLMSTGEW